MRLPDLPANYILQEIAESREMLTYKQVIGVEDCRSEKTFANARQALKDYEDLVLLV